MKKEQEGGGRLIRRGGGEGSRRGSRTVDDREMRGGREKEEVWRREGRDTYFIVQRTLKMIFIYLGFDRFSIRNRRSKK